MEKIILLYTSSTGNTEALAEAVIKGLQQAKVDVTVKDAFNADPYELHEYDGIIIGTYTWEGGVIPDEFMDFYEELDSQDLTDMPFFVFGSGDSYYEDTYGAALKLFATKLIDLGGTMALPIFLVELYPEDHELECAFKLGEQFANIVKQNLVSNSKTG